MQLIGPVGFFLVSFHNFIKLQYNGLQQSFVAYSYINVKSI